MDILFRLENRDNQTWLRVRLEAAAEIRKLRGLLLVEKTPDWVAGFLNRRAAVEQELFEYASGKKPLPTAEQCREMALRLGVPDEHRVTPNVLAEGAGFGVSGNGKA